MIDKMSEQQRLFLAIAISAIFFIGYSYIVPQPKSSMLESNSTKTATVATSAPKAINDETTTPSANTNVQTKAPVSTQAKELSNIAQVKSDKYEMSIDSLGRISSFKVLIDRFKNKDGEFPELISEKNPLKPLEVRFGDESLNKEAFETPYRANSDFIEVKSGSESIKLVQELSSVTITKDITFHKDGSYSLKITLSNDVPYFVSPGFRPDQDSTAYVFKGILIKKGDNTTETIADGKAEGNERFPGSFIASASDRYYTTSFFNFDNPLNVYIQKGADDNPLAFVKGSQNFSTNGYIGAKEYDALSSIDKRLTDIIEYGFFTFISKPIFLFLKYMHSMIGNWGWAIIAITLIIRLLLYPLTYKGMVSMNRLKAYQPKIKEIQKQYKGDPQKMNAKMMEFYKKHNVNPMGGCLPMLMQIPVFFALYRVLLNSVELKHATWIPGWINDLSVMDPYYILPILMGATMFWQQRITPTNYTDPTQEKIMKFLPLIFTFFFVTFPAGLTLYWFVNNLFSVAQQYYVNSIFAKEKALTNG